jgi:microcompartment protein CcmK/EutM
VVLGRVIGTLWSTRRSPRIGGLKLAIVEPLVVAGLPAGADHLVCVDQIGACAGELVLVVFGQPARASTGDERTPIEAAVAAIVDRVNAGEAS